jgi:hypothetical protein
VPGPESHPASTERPSYARPPRPPVLASAPVSARRAGRPAYLATATLALATVLLAGCGVVSTSGPPATPADFPGIASELSRRGLVVDDIVSGDAGCDDQELARTAISFTAQGLDQAEATPIYLYIFRNREAFQRNRAAVDACLPSYVADADDLGLIEASPFVLAGPGPWAPEFAAELRRSLTQSAGTGG